MATRPQFYPGASTAYRYDSKYPGSSMDVNVVVMHSTEGTSLPTYEGGATAPTLTAVPDFKAKKLVWYQHFPFDESARALVNKAGGVETNTLNVAQLEVVGTCDPSTHAKWDKAGYAHLYMPELPDWAVRDLAAFAKWAHDEHGVPLTTVKTWKAYPASYGANGVRMSNSAWNSFKGFCGHQHVPENDHGDPGAFPMAAILAAAEGGEVSAPSTPATPPATKPTTPAKDKDAFPGASTFGPGKSNANVTRLGTMLVARGGKRFYEVGPGPKWSDADKAATQAFQKAQGWTGADADGIPGPATWDLLVTGKGKDIPAAAAARPTVSVANVVDAYKKDRPAKQGATSHPADVKLVESALLKLGYLAAKYAGDGSFGTTTETAYNAFRRAIGMKGADATGAPGKQSLSDLGTKSGLFTVKG